MTAKRIGVLFSVIVGLAIASFPARPAHALPIPMFTNEDRYASVVVDAESGLVLASSNADQILHPASLTKIMTMYMTFEALKKGKIKLTQVLPVSAHAASMTPTELGLKAGDKITTEQAMLGLVTKSANDAAVVLAEALAGSELEFGRLMSEKAYALGMTQSYFVNASGLPNPNQVSSARDMALLALALLRDFRNEYRYFSTLQFSYRGRVYFNHNRLLALYKGTDGIKTGFIRDSGYNLVASAQRDGRRVIGVVFGGSSGRARDAHMITLLDGGFRLLHAKGPKPADTDPAPTMLAANLSKAVRLASTAEFDFTPAKAAAPTKPVSAGVALQVAAKERESASIRGKVKGAKAKRREGIQTVALR